MTATLQEHQSALLEMLCQIDGVCAKNGIRYQLFAGTALGAVRHHGFIPWDDDLDVIMLRPDYERFLEVAPNQLDQDRYYVQGEYSEHWPMFFSKVRMNGTACIERYVPKDPKTHQGVYVDVFPCDNLSDNELVARMQFLASKVIISHSLDRRGYLTDSSLKKAALAVCRHLPQEGFRSFAKAEGSSNTGRVHCFFGAASKYGKSTFPREWLEETVPMEFGGRSFPVSAHYDELLTTLYGDYMTPTPESERNKKVHAELVDLQRSYEEYEGIQREMQFSEYTRSIR